MLFVGKEPNLRWRAFGECILRLGPRLGVRRILFVGSFGGSVPHTREPRLFVTCSDAQPAARDGDIRRAAQRLRGPGSFTSYLMTQARAAGLEMVSLVAEIPGYLQGTNPLSIEAVTRRLAKILKLPLDLDSLRGEHRMGIAGLQRRRAEQGPGATSASWKKSTTTSCWSRPTNVKNRGHNHGRKIVPRRAPAAFVAGHPMSKGSQCAHRQSSILRDQARQDRLQQLLEIPGSVKNTIDQQAVIPQEKEDHIATDEERPQTWTIPIHPSTNPRMIAKKLECVREAVYDAVSGVYAVLLQRAPRFPQRRHPLAN